MVRVTDPNQVRLTGENSYIVLHAGEGGPAVMKASHWRILFSLGGSGHALFLRGNMTGEKPLIYSDNERLARWLQKEVKQVGSDDGDPVTPAVFTRSGDTTSGWREMVNSKRDKVTLTWSHFLEPFIFRSAPGDRPGVVHGVYSLLVPARSGEIVLNGKPAVGKVVSQRLDERASSSACLALSETWVKPDENLPAG